MLQIQSGRESTVSAAVEAELHQSFAVHQLSRFDRGRCERAGCSYPEGTAYLTGVCVTASLHLTKIIICITAG